MGVIGLGARAEARCRELSRPPYSEDPNALTRTYLTPPHRAAMDRIAGWMRETGMSIREDEAATLVGRLEGTKPGSPALVFGSHIDSVRDAGCYDGPLGVMLALACVEAIAAAGRRPPFAIEIVAFGDEEGSRFQTSMNASRAFVGRLAEVKLDVRDRDGTTLADALTAFGRDPTRIASVTRERSSVLAFVEPHIEQGPVLETAGAALGVVTSIAGQWRLKVRFAGRAGHAGTTPMHLRADALAAAAEAVLAAERIATEGPADLVATVGQVAAKPGAPNVIPGHAEITIDVRAGTDPVRDEGLRQIEAAIAEIAMQRGVKVEVERVQNLPAARMDARLQGLLKRAAEKFGHAAPELVSGAGHDAMMLADFAPTAMLFIRCAGGISHNPAESVTPEDCEAALGVLLAFVDVFAAEQPE
ncbi:MAG: allantoate amidohydrolase [Hyphomonadaceae bacterium]|nr:allantoate amidohydrolase [Hyphomonadaceae bacterium]